MAEMVILWERPQGCLCGGTAAGDGAKGKPGRLGVIRDVEVTCPQHGTQKDALELAIDAAEAIARTVPGVELSRVQLKRLLVAAYPIIIAYATGQPLPVPPAPTPEPPAPPV